MHTNHKLNFGHNITFEIFQDNDSPRLEILINEITVFDETFTANVVHKRTAHFYHEYLDRHKNHIEFKFTGTRESSNKYVKLKSVVVNNTILNILRYYWNPEINQAWFNKLSENKKNEVKYDAKTTRIVQAWKTLSNCSKCVVVHGQMMKGYQTNMDGRRRRTVVGSQTA